MTTSRSTRTRAAIALTAIATTAAIIGAADHSQQATAANTAPTTATKAPVASYVEEFNSWPGSASSNGRTKINGDWYGSGGNLLKFSNVRVSGGMATLTSRGNAKVGAEVMSDPARTHGVGYYEASIRMSPTPGILGDIFFISDGYQAPEVDLEVRSRDNGPGKKHYAFLTVHQGDGSRRYQQVALPFDPAAGFHSYGILLGSSTVSFHADGRQLARWTGLKADLGGNGPLKGYLMSNSWAEGSDFVGPIPTKDTTTQIRWMRVWDGATSPRYTKA